MNRAGRRILRSRENDGILRRSESFVRTVHFVAGCSTPRETVIAKDVAFDTIEDPGVVRVLSRVGLPIIGRLELSLAGKADANQLLWGASVSQPQPPISAIQRVVIFTWLSSPSAYATLGTPELDDMREFGHMSDTPVKAVASKVCKIPATLQIGLECIKHSETVVFRM
jgi:hypothetical protein